MTTDQKVIKAKVGIQINDTLWWPRVRLQEQCHE